MRMRIEGIYSSRLTVYCDVVAGFASSHVTAPIPAPRNQQSKKVRNFNTKQTRRVAKREQFSAAGTPAIGVVHALASFDSVELVACKRELPPANAAAGVSVRTAPPPITSPSNKRRNAFQRQQTHPQRVPAQQVLVKRRRGRSDLSRSPLERVAHE